VPHAEWWGHRPLRWFDQVASTGPVVSVHAGQREHRLAHIDGAVGIPATPRGHSGGQDYQGHVQLLVSHPVAVAERLVVTEALAVIGGDDDVGLIEFGVSRQAIQENAQLFVEKGHVPGVSPQGLLQRVLKELLALLERVRQVECLDLALRDREFRVRARSPAVAVGCMRVEVVEEEELLVGRGSIEELKGLCRHAVGLGVEVIPIGVELRPGLLL